MPLSSIFTVSCPKCNWINSYAKRATNLFHNLFCNVLDFPYILFRLSTIYRCTFIFCFRLSSVAFFSTCVCVECALRKCFAFTVCEHPELVYWIFLFLLQYRISCGNIVWKSHKQKHIRIEYRTPAMEPLSLYLVSFFTFCMWTLYTIAKSL